jgi:hypothetical protein
MKKMLKKIGLPVVALLGMLAFAPHQAKAEVRFGVAIGRPAYTYPVYPAPVYRAYPPAVAYVPGPVVVGRPWVGPAIRWDRRHDFRFRR